MSPSIENTPSVIRSWRRPGDFVSSSSLSAAAASRAVDDRGVVQLIGDDHVLFAQDGRHGAGVRSEPRLEHQGLLGTLELGEAALQVSVQGHGPGDRSHGARTGPVLHGRLRRGFLELRMRRQAQVVVRGEVDDVAAVEPRPGGLLAFQDPRMQCGPGSVQLLELFPQILEAALGHRAVSPEPAGG